MKSLFVFSFVFLFAAAAWSQNSYRVYFANKGANEKLLSTPGAFLSEKSVQRRLCQNIPLHLSDVPVYKPYLKALAQMGLQVKAHSKWLNYALVEGVMPPQLSQQPFVTKIEKVRPHQVHFAGRQGALTTFDYGLARDQINMLQGEKLHEAGFTGRGMTIAVLDAGFQGVDTIPFFDSLRLQNRLLGTYNFVRNTDSVFRTGGGHGTAVLSTMAALSPTVFVGTAPHASYWLLTSEDVRSETPAEMDNWVIAAEFADSVGVDVINTSLGYSTFDDSTDNYTYSNMDGNTTVVTQAADWAAQKGILVVASAGNEGAGSWKFITAPADGDSVLTVGAVDRDGQAVSFSSFGPSFDGRVKPDVSALGLSAIVSSSGGSLASSSGTSFSSPIVAGLAACLWQVFPNANNMAIMRNIQSVGHLYPGSDNQLGYGIPNFYDAQRGLGAHEKEAPLSALSLFPNPVQDYLHLALPANDENRNFIKVQIQSTSGMVLREYGRLNAQEHIRLPFDLPKGLYLVKVQMGAAQVMQKIMK